jgi:hypothetical protein
VDAQDVTREIRRLVWPALREQCFEAFTGRTAWRCVGDDIDVVNFRSFSASLADSLGCTTFSFAVNLGVWLAGDEVAEGLKPKLKRDRAGRLRPEEYQCAHRGQLAKSLAQPWFKSFSSDTRRWPPSLRRHREGLMQIFRRDPHDRCDIWFVLPDSSNLADCLEDALRALREDGLPWFTATRRQREAPATGLSTQAEALRDASGGDHEVLRSLVRG